MKTRKRWLSSALVATVAGLALVGCGGGDGGDDEANGTGGGQAASEQVLRWGLGSEFNLDPGLATDTTSSRQSSMAGNASDSSAVSETVQVTELYGTPSRTSAANSRIGKPRWRSASPTRSTASIPPTVMISWRRCMRKA